MPKKGKDAKGEPVHLYNECLIKIFHTGVHPKPAVARVIPPKGKWFGPAEMELIRDEWIDKVDKQFPQWEFRVVQVGGNQFNFIYERDRVAVDQLARPKLQIVPPANPRAAVPDEIREAADISLDTAPHLAYKPDAETVPSKIIKP